MKYLYLALFFFFILFNLGDFLTTSLVIGNYGYEMEANPIARGAFKEGGLSEIMHQIIKLVFLPSLIILEVWVANQSKIFGIVFESLIHSFTAVAISFSIFVFLFATINNLAVAESLGLLILQ